MLIKINTQLLARIALLSDCDKHAVYRNILTARYVIYPEGGGIKRFPGYVKMESSGEGIQRNCALGDKFLQFCMVLGLGIRFSKTNPYKLG